LKKRFTPEFVYPVGTQVELASGSPVLTVVDVDVNTSSVTVAWKDEHGEVEEKIFPSVCLNLHRKHHHL
jgi:uncharacterized protein YodC (DUF2158 family)